MPEHKIKIYSPRKHQKIVHENLTRFSVLVCHRRFGKTILGINALINAAYNSAMRGDHMPRFVYLAPDRTQAKDIAWDWMKFYAGKIPGAKPNESELYIRLPGGAKIKLKGAENPEALRGPYLDGIFLDEFAQMREGVWSAILFPQLTDRRGWAIFSGTPQGEDEFYEKWKYAQADPDWYAAMFRASETGIIPADELLLARAQMTDDEYAQEFECSFAAAVRGAYYAREIERAEAEGRIANVPADPLLPVHTVWDLGVSDSTAIWFFQRLTSGEIRVVDYYAAQGEGLPHYARVLKEKPYLYGCHIGPHDIAVRELGTGKSRLETARGLGLNFEIAPNLAQIDGINAARMILPRCWFDRGRCADGIKALRQYRRVYDEKGKTFRLKPLHDWTSHAADAFRYMAVGLDLAKESGVGLGGQATMQAAEARALYERYGPPRARN